MSSALIRVRLRRGGDDKEILLSFDKSKMSLQKLIQRAANRLGVGDGITRLGLFVDYGDSQVLVEDCNVLFHDDRLVLKQRDVEDQPGGSSHIKEEEGNRIQVTPVKSDPAPDPIQSHVEIEAVVSTVIKSDPGSDQDRPPAEILVEGASGSAVIKSDIVSDQYKPPAGKEAGVTNCASVQTNEDESEEEAFDIYEASHSEEELDDSDEEQSDLEEDSSSNFDDESSVSVAPPKKKRSGAQKGPVPTLEVHIAQQDLPDAPGTHVDDMPDKDYEFQPTLTGASKADDEVKERIMKMLNMGFHEGSNENEAKRAMKMAQKLMKRHNLSQALLLKERDAQNTGGSELLKGGLVKVNVTNLRTGKPSLYLRWFPELVRAVNKSFDVSMFYNVRRGCQCRITFYGIYTNCQLAAYAFKTAAERISMMQATFVPVKKHGVTTSSARLWYSMGIASGLETQANEEVRREEEAHQRKLQRARQAETKGEAYEDSDVEVEDIDGESDGGGHGFSFATPTFSSASINRPDQAKLSDAAAPTDPIEPTVSAASSSYQTLQTRLAELEKEDEAAIVLADQNEKIQKEVLKDQGIKLSTGRKRKSLSSYDHAAFRKGKEDSQEISLKRRAIRDDWSKHVKKEKVT
jgi:arsenate reductase-like glutaredoxin family protein